MRKRTRRNALAVISLGLTFSAPVSADITDNCYLDSAYFATGYFADGYFVECASGGAFPGQIATEVVSSDPGDQFYLAGTAYKADGTMYVEVCSFPDTYFYNEGVAHTAYGAMCIEANGTIDVDLNGWPLTHDGAVAASECEPVVVINGIPRGVDGYACMTNVN